MLIVLVLVVLVVSPTCKVVYYNIPNLSDYKIFPYRTIQNNQYHIFEFDKAKNLTSLGDDSIRMNSSCHDNRGTNFYTTSPKFQTLGKLLL